MTSISPSFSQFFSVPYPLSNAFQSFKKIDSTIVHNVLNHAKEEAVGMSKDFIFGSLFAKYIGINNPFSFGTVLTFSKSAAKRIYPKFHQQFHCTPDTRFRNIFVNIVADLTTTTVANYAAYQVGCNISPDAIIMMKIGNLLIPTLLKAIDTPLNKMSDLLPEMVTTTALSVLFGATIQQYGYKINPVYIVRQQTAAVATSLYMKKCIDTGNYFQLKKLISDAQNEKLKAVESETTAQKSDALNTNENRETKLPSAEKPVTPPDAEKTLPPSPTPKPIQEIKLTDSQKKLSETPQYQIIKSQAIATIIHYLFLTVLNNPDYLYLGIPGFLKAVNNTPNI